MLINDLKRNNIAIITEILDIRIEEMGLRVGDKISILQAGYPCIISCGASRYMLRTNAIKVRKIMPCMGPNLKYAEKEAIIANRIIWDVLHSEFNICPGSKFGVDDSEKFYRMKELLKEIFVENAYNGF